MSEMSMKFYVLQLQPFSAHHNIVVHTHEHTSEEVGHNANDVMQSPLRMQLTMCKMSYTVNLGKTLPNLTAIESCGLLET